MRLDHGESTTIAGWSALMISYTAIMHQNALTHVRIVMPLQPVMDQAHRDVSAPMASIGVALNVFWKLTAAAQMKQAHTGRYAVHILCLFHCLFPLSYYSLSPGQHSDSILAFNFLDPNRDCPMSRVFLCCRKMRNGNHQTVVLITLA